MTTLLKTNQYTGLDSFTNVGPFVPLTVDRHGTVLREVAPAQFLLARPDRDDEPLRLVVALIGLLLLDEPRKKIFLDLAAFYVHTFQDLLICSHHLRRTG